MSPVCLWTLAMMWCHKGHYWPLTDTSTQVSDVNGTVSEQQCYFCLLTRSCKLRFFLFQLYKDSWMIPYMKWLHRSVGWTKNKDQQKALKQDLELDRIAECAGVWRYVFFNHFSLTIAAPPQVCLMHPRAELYTCHLAPASSHSRAWTRDSANWWRSTWDDGLVEENTAWKK